MQDEYLGKSTFLAVLILIRTVSPPLFAFSPFCSMLLFDLIFPTVFQVVIVVQDEYLDENYEEYDQYEDQYLDQGAPQDTDKGRENLVHSPVMQKPRSSGTQTYSNYIAIYAILLYMLYLQKMFGIFIDDCQLFVDNHIITLFIWLEF